MELFFFWGVVAPEDSIFPFPWASSPQNASAAASTNVVVSENTSIPSLDTGKRKCESLQMKKLHSGSQRFADYANRYPQLQDLDDKLNDLFKGRVRFQLPGLDALTGKVVQHCGNFMDELIQSQAPVMFKIGFTHNPVHRWGNPVYGYSSSVEKWSDMVVLYIAPERHSPAMLEAALIDKYKGSCVQNEKHFLGGIVFQKNVNH